MAEPGSTPAAPGFARRLAADTGLALFGRMLSLASWTVLVPFLLRGLGAEGFALWALFFSLTGYLSALDLGFAQGTLRHVAAARARGDGAEAGEFALVGGLGYLVLGAAWLALTPLLREPALDLLRIDAAQRGIAGTLFTLGPVAFACMGTSTVMSAALQGWGRFDLANVVTVSSVVVQVGGAILALSRGWGLLGVVAFAIAGSVVATLTGSVLLRIGATGFEWGSPRRALTRVPEVVAFGGPLQIGNILGVAHQQLDKVLLSRYVALAFVAPYELGLRISTVLGSLPQQMLMALIPQASGYHALGDVVSLRVAHDRAARWVMTITATLSASMLVGGPRLLHAWLGTPPEGADRALVGLTLAMVAAMTTGTGTAIARAMGRTRFEAEYSGLGLVAHLALGLWWVPSDGLDGALLATLVANVLASAWFLFRFARLTGWGLRVVFAGPALQPLVMLALGVLAGRACAAGLPHGDGALAWVWAIVASAVPALVVALLLLATGFVPRSELGAVLGRRRRPGA